MKIFILIYSTHFPNVSSKSIFILFLGEISRENPFNATDIKKTSTPHYNMLSLQTIFLK